MFSSRKNRNPTSNNNKNKQNVNTNINKYFYSQSMRRGETFLSVLIFLKFFRNINTLKSGR